MNHTLNPPRCRTCTVWAMLASISQGNVQWYLVPCSRLPLTSSKLRDRGGGRIVNERTLTLRTTAQIRKIVFPNGRPTNTLSATPRPQLSAVHLAGYSYTRHRQRRCVPSFYTALPRFSHPRATRFAGTISPSAWLRDKPVAFVRRLRFA